MTYQHSCCSKLVPLQISMPVFTVLVWQRWQDEVVAGPFTTNVSNFGVQPQCVHLHQLQL